MDLQYWKTHSEAIKTLSEEDRRIVMREIEAERIRQFEKDKYEFRLMDNQGKLAVIKIWYPRAYETIEKFFPEFVVAPNDFPPAVIICINNMIRILCGNDWKNLQFS